MLIYAHGLARAAAVVGMHPMPYAADPSASTPEPAARDLRAHEASLGLAVGLGLA